VAYLTPIDHGDDSRRPGAASDWLYSQLESRPMQGPAAERFVVVSLRLLALTFAVVGLLFIAVPSGVLDVISDLGDWIGSFPRAPHTQEDLWLALAFAYMVVITGICLVAQADVVRYRPLLLVLAAGKTASSLGSLAFYLVDEHVFIYLLNFLVDGSLVFVALWLWVLAGRIGRPADPG
jgi:nitric oxide reductase large subunit